MRTLTADDLADLYDWPRLIDCLRDGFTGECRAPLRQHYTIEVSGAPDGTLLTMPAWTEGDLLGVKLVTVFPGNERHALPAVMGVYVLSSATTGEPLLTLDGTAMTLWRTAAASALAAGYLARPDSNHLLMVGTGRLAPNLIRAHAAVRSLGRVSVWGRSPDKAARLVASLDLPGVDVAVARELEAAAREADIISCATLAQDPLVSGDWLSPGVHLDLVGGYTPRMREADDAAVRRATVFVDTRDGAAIEAGDIVQPLENGTLARDDIAADLFDLCAGRHPGRSGDQEITLIKLVGTALEDLAAARLAWTRAENRMAS